jgi:acylphosphatase
VQARDLDVGCVVGKEEDGTVEFVVRVEDLCA